MSDEVAISGSLVSPTDGTGAGLPVSVEGSAVISVPILSTVLEINGNKTYMNGTSISITSITSNSAGATIPDPGPYVSTIVSARRAKENGVKVIAEGDKTGIMNATPQIPGTPPTPFPITFRVSVISGGQTKVRSTV